MKNKNKQNKNPSSPKNKGGRQELNKDGQDSSTKQTKRQYVKTYENYLTDILQKAHIDIKSKTTLRLVKLMNENKNDEEADDSFIEMLKYECDLILKEHKLAQIKSEKPSESKFLIKNKVKKDRKKEIEEGVKGLKKLDSKRKQVVTNLFTLKPSKKSKGIQKSKGIPEIEEPIMNKYSEEDIKKLSSNDKVILFAILGKIVNPNNINSKTLYFKLYSFNGKDEWVNNLMKTNKALVDSIIKFIKPLIRNKNNLDKYEKLFIKVFNCSNHEDMNESRENERRSQLKAQRYLFSELRNFFIEYKFLFSTIFKYNTIDTFEKEIFKTEIAKQFREHYKCKILEHISIKDDGLCLIKAAYNLGLFNTKLKPKDIKERCENKFVLLELEKIRIHYNNSDKNHQLKYLIGLPAIFYGKGVSCQNKYGNKFIKYELYDLSKKPLVNHKKKQHHKETQKELSFIDLSKCARNCHTYQFVENQTEWYDIITKLSYNFCPLSINKRFITQQKIDFANILANNANVPTIRMSVLRSESNIHTALKNKLISCLTGTEISNKLKSSRINKVFKYFNDNNLFSLVGSYQKLETWIQSNIINSHLENEAFNHGLETLKEKLEDTFKFKVDDKWSQIEDLKKNLQSKSNKTSAWSKNLLHEENILQDTNSTQMNEYNKEYFEICSKLGKEITRKEQKRFSGMSNKNKLLMINRNMKQFIGSDRMRHASDNSINYEEFPKDKYVEMKKNNYNFNKNTAIIIIKMWLQNNKMSIQDLIEKVKHIINPSGDKDFLESIKTNLYFYRDNQRNREYSTHYRKYMKECFAFFHERIDLTAGLEVIPQVKYILNQPIQQKHIGMIAVLKAHARYESKRSEGYVYDFITNIQFNGDGSDLKVYDNYDKEFLDTFPEINESSESITKKEEIKSSDNIIIEVKYEDGARLDKPRQVNHTLPESLIDENLSNYENLLLVAYENLNGHADDHLKEHLDKTIHYLKEIKSVYEENEHYHLDRLSFHGSKEKKEYHRSRKIGLIVNQILRENVSLPEETVKIMKRQKQEKEKREQRKADVRKLFKFAKKKQNKRQNPFKILSDEDKDENGNENEIQQTVNELYSTQQHVHNPKEANKARSSVKKCLIQLEWQSKRNQVNEIFSEVLKFYKAKASEKSKNLDADEEKELVQVRQ
jgi:hypothetical protein